MYFRLESLTSLQSGELLALPLMKYSELYSWFGA